MNSPRQHNPAAPMTIEAVGPSRHGHDEAPAMTTPLPLTPELVEDPVHGYADLRARPGLGHVVLPGLTTPVRLVTRYEDVRAALTEPRLVRDRSSVPGGSDLPDRRPSYWRRASTASRRSTSRTSRDTWRCSTATSTPGAAIR
ncbi:cytochrome P450 [Streptomyces dysideae]|uniref:cytochrome P450 n=1 Tax=Streptomyces dysideae TaxID=909626 RepID=UPI001F38A254|nr:cytochrome P450 [Streptomyces dysideae]